MKFICKDFWTTVFKKQIDNLRTNHQGIYVLQDNKFRLLTQLSAGKQYLEHASKYLAFTCGLIRGGLSNLGIKSIVTAEVSSMPACKFQVMIQKLQSAVKHRETLLNKSVASPDFSSSLAGCAGAACQFTRFLQTESQEIKGPSTSTQTNRAVPSDCSELGTRM